MVKSTIQIFARVKPTRAKTGPYSVDDDEEGHPRLSFNVPKELADGFINNKKENYNFRFQQVFDQKTKQEDVFEAVARPVIDNVLEGYNGTIFAYGQTGSGKTFTITGGAERYIDRGIIPRTLSYIFEQYEQNPDKEFSLHVSYLEIYNESGYDLLDPKHEAAKLEDLPKVSLLEDSDQNIHLKNLSVHPANNEEEALNLLFLGDTNRMIAETPMNQASTRSHCIFTIHIMSRETGSATIRRSKLHLVDLAGSERVSKTGVNGVLLTEAKYINLSLHFLEQVIISLADKSRQHIPYRNSMMTSVLRDSLGGNCMTTMIATCSVEKKNIDESISTCRFAQRVALIKNEAILNEELDPKLMIAKLKREIQQLKEELAMATGEQRTDELTTEELQRCQEIVQTFLSDPDVDTVINVGADMRKIQHCYKLLKKAVLEKPSPSSSDISLTNGHQVQEDTGPYSNAEVSKLKDLVLQRDNEINILVGMLKKEKKRASDAMTMLEKAGQSNHRSLISSVNQPINGESSHQVRGHSEESDHQSRRPASDSRRRSDRDMRVSEKEKADEQKYNHTQYKILGNMSMGRQEAFEIFRRDYRENHTIEDQKRVLKLRYQEAKRMGEQVNQARANINHIKGQIEQYRMTQAMQGLRDVNQSGPDETEQRLRDKIEEEKARYKETFNELRTLKTEIEHLQHLLEKSKVKLMKDFELWWADQVNMSAQNGSQPARSAWKTPPVTPSTRGVLSTSSSQSSLASRGEQPGNGWSKFTSKPPVPGIGRTQPNYDMVNSTNNLTSTHNRPSSSRRNIPLTGDAKADADIMAFVRARENIIKQEISP
ncbi:kinesin-like protein KIF6 [Liolophura sinensis]|uniref:kinesin-like protein KIF6 n=1 Tax=Liolophura sinensis TaxID=3198878 RepID=UPI0031584B9F